MYKLLSSLLILFTLIGVGFCDNVFARGYDTHTYASANISLKISALNVTLNGSFNDKAYHHGSISARLRMDKHISVAYSYRKDENTGNVSQYYGVYYNFTIIE